MRRSKAAVYVHFIWATWDRMPLITPDIERRLHRHIEATCRDRGCVVLAINGTEDHIHLLVALPSTLAFADLMHDVKGASSRFIAAELVAGDGFRWQGAYGAFSVSPHDRKRVIAYIENQKRHHADGSLWPAAEEVWEPPDHALT